MSFRNRIRASRPTSLRTQLLSRSLLVLAILLVLIGALQYVLMKNALFRNQAEALSLQVRSIPVEMWEPDRMPHNRPSVPNNDAHADNSRQGDRPLLFLPNMSLAKIATNGSYTDLASDNGLSAPQLAAEAYTSILEQFKERRPVPYEVIDDAQGTEQIVVFRPYGSPNSPSGILQLGMDTQPLHAVLLRQLLIFAVLALLAMAGGIALYLPLLRKTLNPLSRMVETVERTDAGNLAERFPAMQGQQEIDRLAQSFNGMLERLEDAFEAEREAKEQMRRFIADASHELRTPLTSIHGFLEVLGRGAADNKDQLHAALSSMHGESKRMKKLVEDLLLLAKLDRKPELHLQDARLDRLLLEMEPHLRMLAQGRNVTIQAAVVLCRCDPDKIKQVIYNLFHNAVQHTDPATGQITVTVDKTKDHAILLVSDNGAGIPKEHLPHLFERFYRIDESRTRQHGGAGLGLSITQSIMNAHGGQMSVDSTVNQGTVFRAEWPGIIL
ncbi:MAG: HAMP domain-containing histidine kinase [Paenibacillus lautus]|uniref:sensor histidine kinase n=1 Tax=Paenibacillus lautus TaxID=1401 RepID=UPI0010D91908|nr:HAMP domain-containing sensor histidine kinase [Paenibacillus lautus]MCI1772466.1 HAMP domain-containing histidine kinase [Paenibacillus lautus]VTR60393.1 phosphate regulon sensor protein [Actinobacillus pleuropneumoniae]